MCSMLVRNAAQLNREKKCIQANGKELGGYNAD